MTKRVPRIGGRRSSARATDTGAVNLPTFTVATVPAAANRAGQMIYVSNGAAGQPVAAISDGTNWKRQDTAGNIAAS